ncbi:MAG: hypothetical protein QM783_15665 [Phycisphaerales bacterium]
MSRAPVTTQSAAKRPSAALAILKAGDAYKYVIAAGGGGAPLRVTDTGSISATDPKALESLRQRAGGSAAFVQVVPPEAGILRSAPPKLVLDGTPEQVAGALELVAEAELPASIPSHRRAAGVVRAGHAHAVYAMGWIGGEGSFAPEAAPVPAPAALGALFRLTGAPSGLLVYTDAATGVIALLGAGTGESPRLVVRVLRDDGSDAEAFTAVRDEAVEDLRLALDAEEPVRIGGSLQLPKRASVSGLGGDDRLTDFALPLGAAAFVLEAKPDELPLLSMSDRSPTAGRSIFTRIGEGLATPRALAVTAALCVCLMLTGWILAAPVKLALLQKRVGSDTGDYTKAVQQHDWFKALKDRRWPLTALIAELTSGAPESVRVESLTVDQGRAINITGSAEKADTVDAWCKSLRGKVFTDVERTIPQEDVSPVRFTIKATVVDAQAAAVSDLKPIANVDTPRVKGDSTPTRSDRSDRTDRNSRTGSNRPSGNSGGNNNGSRTGSRTGSTPGASTSGAEIPHAMTEAQINKLDSAGATLEWAKRKGQLSRSDLDTATRSRLESELNLLEARRKALGGGQ